MEWDEVDVEIRPLKFYKRQSVKVQRFTGKLPLVVQFKSRAGRVERKLRKYEPLYSPQSEDIECDACSYEIFTGQKSSLEYI